MADIVYAEYGVELKLPFELYSTNGVDFATGAVYVTGDIKIDEDGEGEANHINDAMTDEGTGYSVTLTSTEMQSKKIMVYIADQTGPKVWMDKAICIYTINHASAHIPNFWADVQEWLSVAASVYPEGPKKNEVFNNLGFVMRSSVDHIEPKTSLSVSGERSIDGDSFVAVVGALGEIGNGVYQFDGDSSDMNGDLITFRFYASGADDTFVTIKTTA